MEKLDRLGWAAGVSCVAYGVRLGVRVNNPEALERILALLPPGWRPTASPVVNRLYSVWVGGAATRSNVRRFNLLYVDSVRLARTTALDELYEGLASDLQLYVAAAARRRLFVHAGVVGWRGRAIVLPGCSFSGKTTLVAALLQAGATYYSDEYAVFDAHGRVHPYAKPLALRDKTSQMQSKVPVETLGSPAGTKPLPVGLVVITRYRPGAQWRPRRLSPGQATLALLANTVSARRKPKEALARLSWVASHVPVLKGTRGEADEVVQALVGRLDG